MPDAQFRADPGAANAAYAYTAAPCPTTPLGQTPLLLIPVWPQATVYATDIAVEFVGLAEQRAVRQGLTNVVCQQADAERLAQFGDGSVDAVTCCMGLM